MNCDSAREGIQDLLDGALDAAREGEVLDHLRGCPACARARDEIVRAVGLLRAAGDEAPPPDFKSRVMRAVLREPAWGGGSTLVGPPRGKLRPLPLRFAAALGAVAIAGLFAWKAVVREGEVAASDRANLARGPDLDASPPSAPEDARGRTAFVREAPAAPRVPPTEPVGGVYDPLGAESGRGTKDLGERFAESQDEAGRAKEESLRSSARSGPGAAREVGSKIALGFEDRVHGEVGDKLQGGEDSRAVLQQDLGGPAVDSNEPRPSSGSDDFLLGRLGHLDAALASAGEKEGPSARAPIYALRVQSDAGPAVERLRALLAAYAPPEPMRRALAKDGPAPPAPAAPPPSGGPEATPEGAMVLEASVPVDRLAEFDASLRAIPGLVVTTPLDALGARLRFDVSQPDALRAEASPTSRPTEVPAEGFQRRDLASKSRAGAAGTSTARGEAPVERVAVRLYLLLPSPSPPR